MVVMSLSVLVKGARQEQPAPRRSQAKLIGFQPASRSLTEASRASLEPASACWAALLQVRKNEQWGRGGIVGEPLAGTPAACTGTLETRTPAVHFSGC